MNSELQQYGFDKTTGEIKEENALAKSNESRAVAEVQAQYVIAKKFPRDENAAFMRIMKACERPLLAEQATYEYPRGGTNVQGPSIRLAEALAQAWGNIDCGIKEISQNDGSSIVESYAIDLETNMRVGKIFHVAHTRDTKQGKKRLTDAREIYMEVANQGARRLRACILAVIPGDVSDAALERCKKTEKSSTVPIADRTRSMVVKFDEVGVKSEHIEKRLGHKLDIITSDELVSLQAIYRSIRDGMADRSDYFDIKGKDSARNQLTDTLNKVKGTASNESNNSVEECGPSNTA